MEHIDTFRQFLNELFTPAQQVSLVIITLCVYALTAQFKVIYFGFRPLIKNGRTEAQLSAFKAAIIHTFALVTGIVGGLIGYSIGPVQPLWFWVVSGILSGITAIIAHKFFIKIIWRKWMGKE